MANTTNYNWETPDDTDLVKDGAAAIRTLGSSIDTTTKALNPSTTLGDIEYRSSTANTNARLAIGSNGQILSVSGGVPAWINNDQGDITEVQAGTGISVASGTGPIPVITNTVATTIDAAGDLLYGTAADTVGRLAIGTAGQVLKVNSGATAPEWGAAGGATGLTLVKTQTVGSGVSSVTVSDAFSSTYANYLITTSGILASQNQNSSLQFGTTTTGYYWHGTYGSFSSSTVSGGNGNNSSAFSSVLTHTTTSSNMLFHAHAPYLSTVTVVNWRGSQVTTDGISFQYQGFLNNTTSYTSFKLTPGDGTLTGGTIYVYGYNL